MRVVVDTNVVASALIRPSGWTARALVREDLEVSVPEVVLDELEEHEAEFAGRAGCSREEWRSRIRLATSRIGVVRTRDGLKFSGHPMVLRARAVDSDDAFLVAAFLAAQARFLWTRDGPILRAFPEFAVREVPSPA